MFRNLLTRHTLLVQQRFPSASKLISPPSPLRNTINTRLYSTTYLGHPRPYLLKPQTPLTTTVTTTTTALRQFATRASTLSKLNSTPKPLTLTHRNIIPSLLLKLPTTTTQCRTLFGFAKRDRITIPGAKIPVSPWKRLRKWIFILTILGLLGSGLALYWLLYLTDHIDQVMRFNIRFRGQSDIHYYATASRVNHKYSPQFTGDKVSDIKLLQAKLIRDVYKIYLATDPMERNQDMINRYLGDQKVRALREMAAQDPQLAGEITKEVFLEAQYGLTVTTDVINAILQNILSIYLSTTFTNPTHRHSVEHLHKQFEDLKILEQDLEPMVEFTTACLDALVEGSVATPYQDPKKVRVYEPSLVDRNRFATPV